MCYFPLTKYTLLWYFSRLLKLIQCTSYKVNLVTNTRPEGIQNTQFAIQVLK